jgi:hypothetical protein
MFPQAQPAFNPQQATQSVGSGIASAFGSLGARPATQTGTFNPTMSLPQPQMGAVPYVAAPQASGFKIAVPQVIPSSIISGGPTTATVSNIHSAYQSAQQYDNANPTSTATIAPATPQPDAIASDPAIAANGTANNLPAAPATPTNPYAEYAQQLASAQGYSPEYLAALKNKQAVDAQKAQLTSNYYTGANLPGDTLGYAGGFTTRESALNDITGLRAEQALQVQTLLRQGNIDAATSLVNAYKPQEVSPGSSLVDPATGQEQYSGLGGYQAVQSIQTVNNLAQAHPDAGIVPTDNLVTAAQKVSSSPSFQAGNLIAYATPAGGIGYINKLDVNKLQRNADGTYQLIGDAAAASSGAAKAAIADLTKQRADTQAAITTADANFPLLLNAVKAAGLNNNAPLVNEINQKIANKTSKDAALATLNTLVPSLQTEYSRIIARGGSVDDKTRNSAQAIVNGTYSFAQLQAVYNTVKAEGQNVLKGFDDEITRQSQSLGGSSSSGTVSWGDL